MTRAIAVLVLLALAGCADLAGRAPPPRDATAVPTGVTIGGSANAFYGFSR